MPRATDSSYLTLVKSMGLDSTRFDGFCQQKKKKQGRLIDLTNMSTQDQILLRTLLQKMSTKSRFKADSLYTWKVKTSNAHKATSCAIKLSHTIIKRLCNPRGKHKGEYRYEVVANEPSIGIGRSSTIFHTIGTVQPDASFKQKDRVVKVFDNDLDVTLNTTNVFAEHEYRMTPPSLGMKPPVYVNGVAHLFMRYVKGETIGTFLEDRKFTEFSRDEQISFLKDLAIAVKDQVFKQNRIHGDISPNNIMTCSSDVTKRWDITIIDFGGAQSLESNCSHHSGTKGYKSPEAEDGTKTKKSDIYSLGCIYRDFCKQANITQSDAPFHQMLAANPKDRLGIHTVINELDAIKLETKVAKLALTD